ncbi:MAG TPA: heme-binding domain-containing protein [Acidimicrobiia bacterium]|nr:heme-binding domain-containing protein [Acidimicrobiia bacterium]
MPKWLKLGVIVAVAVFVVAQLVPKRVSDAAVKAEPPWDSPTPLSWWIARYVDGGRRALNFSEFDPNHHRSGERIAHEVQEGTMPPAYYTWFLQHSESKLSAADKDALIKGLTATYGPAVGVVERKRRPGGD